MTLHRNPSRGLARWGDVALAASLLVLLASIFAAAGAAWKPERDAQIVISYGCDPVEPSPS
jgi:hypothetical protein